MKPIILYTNDLVDIIHIPLEDGKHTKEFYIVEKNTNNGAYLPSINGFITVREFKNSILFLEGQIEAWKYDIEHVKRLKKYVNIYNSIKTNWANTKFIDKNKIETAVKS